MTIRTTEERSQIQEAVGANGQPCLGLGAHATLQAAYDAAGSPQLLHNALDEWFAWQRRTTITVEQAVLSPNLAPQWIAALLALGAWVTFDGDSSEYPLEDFLPRKHSHGGRLVSLCVPLGISGRVYGEAHIGPMPAAAPIVSAVAVIDFDDKVVRQARLALTGVWHEHARLAESTASLVGSHLNDSSIEGVALEVEQEVEPPDNFLGSAEYRRAMAGILAQRALHACRMGAERHG